MTPKEKAEALLNKFTFASIYFTDKEDGAKLNAKTCALLAVDAIMEDLGLQYLNRMAYWQEVKEEIENL